LVINISVHAYFTVPVRLHEAEMKKRRSIAATQMDDIPPL